MKTHQTATKSQIFSGELSSNDQGFFPCPEKNCKFKPAESEIILKKHMRREHSIIFPSDVKPDDQSYTYLQEDLPKKVDGWLQCPECDFKTVHAIWHLKRHMTNVHQSVIIGESPRMQAKKRKAELIAQNSSHAEDAVYEPQLSLNWNNSSNSTTSPTRSYERIIRTRKRTRDETKKETLEESKIETVDDGRETVDVQPQPDTPTIPNDFAIDL